MKESKMKKLLITICLVTMLFCAGSYTSMKEHHQRMMLQYQRKVASAQKRVLYHQQKIYYYEKKENDSKK